MTNSTITNRFVSLNSFAGKAAYRGLFATSCLVGLAMAAGTSPLKAAPTGGNVVGGAATINNNGKQTNITQSTDRAVINWNSFSVNRDESVTFSVPNGGATLNRVIGFDPSNIQGSLSSNGTLYLVNPNGLTFDVNSQITAQNFIATTANIDTSIFMAGGKLDFNQASNVKNAKITLKGTIAAADRGIVGIFAPQVDNQGTITANLGSVVLAGSNRQVIDFNGDGLMNFELGAADALFADVAHVKNSGNITASGGHVLMTAKGAQTLFNSLVENSGNINANSLTAKGGTVTIKAESGSVTESGNIEASGVAGGGDVLVWGSENADFTGSIKAEALEGGNKTNGGSVEVSGIKHIYFAGRVSTLSHNGGKKGTLLIDPSDIEIVSKAPSGGTEATPGAPRTPNAGTYTSNSGTSYILASTLVASLVANNVTVDARGGTGTSTSGGATITISTSIDTINIGSLTLKAGTGGIAVNANLGISTEYGTLTFDTTGTVRIKNNVTIRAKTVEFNSVTGITGVLAGDIGAISGTVALSSATGITSSASNFNMNAAITQSAGDLTIRSTAGGMTIGGSITNTGRAVTLSAAGGMAINNTINAGSLSLTTSAAGNIIQGGDATSKIVTSGNVTANLNHGSLMLNNANNQVASLGAITAKNVVFNNGIALRLNGDITATGAVGAPGIINIANNGGATDGLKNISLGANVKLKSGNYDASRASIFLDLGGSTNGGTFSNGSGNGFTLTVGDVVTGSGGVVTGGQNIGIFAKAFSFASGASAVATAIEAGSSNLIFTDADAETYLLFGDSSLTTASFNALSARTGLASTDIKIHATGSNILNQIKTLQVVDGTLTISGLATSLANGVVINAGGAVIIAADVTNTGNITIKGTRIAINAALSTTGTAANGVINLESTSGSITQNSATAIITADKLVTKAAWGEVWLNYANGVASLGTMEGDNVYFANSKALTLTGNITANGKAAAGQTPSVAGKIFIVNRDALTNPDRNISLAANIQLISLNSANDNARKNNITLDLGGNGTGIGGIFSNAGFQLSTNNNQNLAIVAGGFNLSTATAAGQIGGFAINAGTGQVGTYETYKTTLATGTQTLRQSDVAGFVGRNGAAFSSSDLAKIDVPVKKAWMGQMPSICSVNITIATPVSWF